jgi:hypothetical protein
MLHPSDPNTGWRSALHSLAQSLSADPADKTPQGDPPTDAEEDAEREPFHLDDTELAKRLVRDRGLIHYSTPPHARLVFPDMVQP